MATKEESIIDAIITEIGNISTENGFSFDIGSNYADWRDTELDDSELPFINVREIEDRIIEDDEHEHILFVDIDLMVAGSATAAKDARNKKQDILTAMNNFYSNNISSLIAGIRYGGSIYITEHEIKKFTGVTLNFQITYYEDFLEV